MEARVIDLDGAYDPCRPNDRLLLGMKGSISEFELGVLRARMFDAARSKVKRGELRIPVPIGYVWDREVGLGFDPDMRLQETIRLIFTKFRKLGSARQVLSSMAADRIHFPRPSDGKRLTSFDWTAIRYRNVISVLKNPFYAGVYVYGKSGSTRRRACCVGFAHSVSIRPARRGIALDRRTCRQYTRRLYRRSRGSPRTGHRPDCTTLKAFVRDLPRSLRRG